MELEKTWVELYNKKRIYFLPIFSEFLKIGFPDVKPFFDYAGKFYFEKIKSKRLLKEGIKYFEQMKEDIMSNLD